MVISPVKARRAVVRARSIMAVAGTIATPQRRWSLMNGGAMAEISVSTTTPSKKAERNTRPGHSASAAVRREVCTADLLEGVAQCRSRCQGYGGNDIQLPPSG